MNCLISAVSSPRIFTARMPELTLSVIMGDWILSLIGITVDAQHCLSLKLGVLCQHLVSPSSLSKYVSVLM
eukprot:scaffold5943_cov129-Skeletonema_dohrnii-CCMP3373.AAC.1